MNLRQAVSIVIAQNKSVGPPPTRFMNMTANGDHPDLEKIISNVVFSPDAFTHMIDQISKYKEVLSIEDLIAVADDNFNLDVDVIKISKENASRYANERGKYHVNDEYWVKKFFVIKK